MWAGRHELDLVARRGRRLVFCEVKSKSGEGRGDPLEMVGVEKRRRLRVAAEVFLATHPDVAGLECSFEVIAVRGVEIERVVEAFDAG